MNDERGRTVLHLWRALATRDWEAVKSVVTDDCVFLDMPLGPTLAARGPDDIVKRLRGCLENENLADWANRDVLLLTNGVDVMYEHLVTYTSTNGEVTNNPIVSVHKVSNGKISLWKDYWDFNAIANAAWFQSSLADADLSWVFDATDLV
jgi:limonene-1,2-epoxide hydrolase